jgi:hypothetical protein
MKSYIPAIYLSSVIFFLIILTNLRLLKRLNFWSRLIELSVLAFVCYLLSVWIISNYFYLNTIFIKDDPHVIAGIVKSLKEESTHRIVVFYNYDLDRDIAIDVSTEDYSKINLNDSVKFKLYIGKYNILFDDRTSILNGGRIRPIGY